MRSLRPEALQLARCDALQQCKGRMSPTNLRHAVRLCSLHPAAKGRDLDRASADIADLTLTLTLTVVNTFTWNLTLTVETPVSVSPSPESVPWLTRAREDIALSMHLTFP